MYRGRCHSLQGLNYKTKIADTPMICCYDSFEKGKEKNSHARLKQWAIHPTILLNHLLTNYCKLVKATHSVQSSCFTGLSPLNSMSSRIRRNSWAYTCKHPWWSSFSWADKTVQWNICQSLLPSLYFFEHWNHLSFYCLRLRLNVQLLYSMGKCICEHIRECSPMLDLQSCVHSNPEFYLLKSPS